MTALTLFGVDCCGYGVLGLISGKMIGELALKCLLNYFVG